MILLKAIARAGLRPDQVGYRNRPRQLDTPFIPFTVDGGAWKEWRTQESGLGRMDKAEGEQRGVGHCAEA